jgi:hypothetical protein
MKNDAAKNCVRDQLTRPTKQSAIQQFTRMPSREKKRTNQVSRHLFSGLRHFFLQFNCDHDKKVLCKMKKISVCFLLILIICGSLAKPVEQEKDEMDLKVEPRIFFKQMMEATGIFPLEINVPDMMSSMMSGMSSMYQAVSSYFSGSSGEEDTPMQEAVKTRNQLKVKKIKYPPSMSQLFWFFLMS